MLYKTRGDFFKGIYEPYMASVHGKRTEGALRSGQTHLTKPEEPQEQPQQPQQPAEQPNPPSTSENPTFAPQQLQQLDDGSWFNPTTGEVMEATPPPTKTASAPVPVPHAAQRATPFVIEFLRP